MIKDFKDKTVVITGGANGIGRAGVRTFLDLGANVVIADRDEAAIEETLELMDAGQRLHAVYCELTSYAENLRLAAETEEVFGGANLVWLNAAQLGAGGPWRASEVRVFEFDRIIAGTLNAPFYGIHAFLPQLQRQEEAHIAATCSVFSLTTGIVDPAPYWAAKAGLLSFMETLYLDLTDRGSHIGTSAIITGNTRTGIVGELNRLLAASEADPSLWNESAWGPRHDIKTMMDWFKAGEASAPEDVSQGLAKTVLEGKFYCNPNPGRHWKYIRERFERILALEDPGYGDRNPDTYIPLPE